MYSTIYLNNNNIDMVDGMVISAAFTALMTGNSVVVSIRDNTKYGVGTVGVMVNTMTLPPYAGNTLINMIKLASK